MSYHAPVVLILLSLSCSSPPAAHDEPEAPACPDGEILEDDTAGCVPERCGAGLWPDEDAVVFVDGHSGGDGSKGSPASSVQEGVDWAASLGGGVVAVAAGTYPGTLALTTDHDGVVIMGRCLELVTLVGDGSGRGAVNFESASAGVALQGLSITGGTSSGIVVGAFFGGGTLSGRDLRVADSAGAGIHIGSGSHARLENVEIHNTSIAADDRGRGLVSEGGTIEADGLVVVDSAELGVFSNANGQVTVRDAVVSGTGSRGFTVQNGAHVSMERVVIEDAHEAGLMLSGVGSVALLRDVAIRRVDPNASGDFGLAIHAAEGGHLEASGVTVEDAHESGIRMRDQGTRGTLVDVSVTGVLPIPDGRFGWGIDVHEGAELTADALRLWDNHQALVVNAATVAAVGLRVSGSQEGGMEVYNADVLLEDGQIEGNVLFGLKVHGPDASVELVGGRIADNDSARDGLFGRAVELSNQAELFTDGLVVEDNPDTGIFIDEGARAVVRNTTVRRIRPMAVGRFGWGVSVEFDGSIEADGLVVDTATEFALFLNDGGQAVLRDSVLRGTQRGQTYQVAAGLFAQLGATVDAQGLKVEGNQGAGLYVTEAAIDCSMCSIRDNAFAGAAVLQGGQLRMVDSVVEEVRSDAALGGGVGVLAWTDGAPASLLLEGVTSSGAPLAALWVEGPATVEVRDSTLAGGSGFGAYPGITLHGNAVFARDVPPWDSAVGLVLQSSLLTGEGEVGALFHQCTGHLTGNIWGDPSVPLRQQGTCDELEPPGPDLPPAWGGCNDTWLPTLYLRPYLKFVDSTVAL